MFGGLALATHSRDLAARGGDQKPNIIYIMTDDHAAHALSCYGSKINKTPNLDRIASEGMRFTNCFVTNSLCAPSRAVCLTGKYSHINGVIDNGKTQQFDGTQQTFPKLLQKAGYKTGIVGKWHLVSNPTGFDYWNILPGQGIYHDPVLIEMGEKKKHQGYVTDIITDLAIDFVNKSKGQPFCLLYHHKAPHREWQPDAKHADMFKERDIAEPATFNDDYKHRASSAEHADMRVANMPDYEKELKPGMSPEEIKKFNYQRYIKDYLRVVASVDDNVGRMLEYLDKAGLAENTIVVYTSDNGFFLGDHGWFDKRFMYEESLRVPLLVRYPREVKQGSVNDRFVINADFAPTFLDFAVAPIPGDIQGRSIRPLLRGEAPKDWRKSVYYHYYEYPAAHRVRPHYGVRTERYKLICYPTVEEWELFDLEKDPRELRNVYADASYADVAKQMKAELERLRRELKDNT
ncbi:sulfatase [Candidatus Sumerlaeota bacterium]|nr:sulfatase [Candidatus Sumerlaeota bacterium]